MSMPKLAFSVSITPCAPPSEYAALMRVCPTLGTSTIRSRGKLTTNVFCALGSMCATISVSERCPSTLGSLLGSPNCRASLELPESLTNCRLSEPMMR